MKQAQEDVRWAHRHKELLDRERELMKNVDGWVVGQRRYYTTWEDKPDVDAFDTKRMGPW